MALEQKIILEVNDIELSFNVNVTAYNKFLNQSNQVNKIQPATNFLMTVVDSECKAALKEMLALPGAALHLVGSVVEEYQPEFNITVKK
ncbi:putative phage gene [Moritella sp. PE36]|uniref:putative phage tail assembly chaperone n=1 Tax=Moritella sp. PE36 TaxID=58051 RepID=UPI0001568903|nr:putative phage tail assembly chaperone [Moritella sp. PE36]EDM65079.1 putative phage gene [Moritella sp. PE36]EDM67303.1 putative phage gene [Moritella sp. PE36]